jgi:hypothetical protein
MLQTLDSPRVGRPAAAAADALASLYAGIAGVPPVSVRAYQDDDAILVLMRFDPASAPTPNSEFDPPIEVSLLALPDLIAEAVLAETGRELLPGSLSVSVERGFAVLAFRLHEPSSWPVVGLFELERTLAAAR